MVDKYVFVCIMFNVIKNAVTDISLDYYFGFDDALRSSKYLEKCNDITGHMTCQQRCGSNYACLLGICFCVEVKPSIKQDSVLNQILQRQKDDQNVRAKSYQESSSVESESVSDESYPNYMKLEELALRPTLRHHIAHFCPNLDKARACIVKCMELGKPAFCGKDHVCYCGHKYGTPNDDTQSNKNEDGPFADLYAKYFGPKVSSLSKVKKVSTSDDKASEKDNSEDQTEQNTEKDWSEASNSGEKGSKENSASQESAEAESKEVSTSTKATEEGTTTTEQAATETTTETATGER